MTTTRKMTKSDKKNKKKPRERRPNKLNVKKVQKAIEGSGGVVQVLAERCGVARQNMYLFLKKHPELKEELEQADEQVVDFAEAKMIRLINEGNSKDIRWYLERKAKHRGYATKVEQENLNVQVDTSVEEWERRLLKIKTP